MTINRLVTCNQRITTVLMEQHKTDATVVLQSHQQRHTEEMSAVYR